MLSDELFLGELDGCRLQRSACKWLFLSSFFGMSLTVNRNKKQKYRYDLCSNIGNLLHQSALDTCLDVITAFSPVW